MRYPAQIFRVIFSFPYFYAQKYSEKSKGVWWKKSFY